MKRGGGGRKMETEREETERKRLTKWQIFLLVWLLCNKNEGKFAYIKKKQ